MIDPREAQLLQPYLAVADAERALEFYVDVFEMSETYRLPMPDGRIGHAELRKGSIRLLLSDPFPEGGVQAPDPAAAHASSLLLYVEDLEATLKRAMTRGSRLEREPKDEFFGDRTAAIIDPFGHRWFIHQRLETLAPEEIMARFNQQSG
ncbi:MAG: VOC family protein [Myxococcota bacterium]